MRDHLRSFCAAIALLASGVSARADMPFTELQLLKETQPHIVLQAQDAARAAGYPVCLYLRQGVLLEVLAMNGGEPVYGVITNPAHPFDGGYTATFAGIREAYDLTSAIDLTRGPAPVHPGSTRRLETMSEVLLVPDWTSDRVMAFDPATGDLLDTAFIPSSPVILQSPKEAVGSPRGTITVSDQISDAVQDFGAEGTYLGLFAPAGGVNTSILDNIRGHAYQSNGNLLVTVASGSNAHAIAQFDSAGNYLGNFIGNAVGGLNSPFCILLRDADILVSQSSAPTGVKQYGLDGAYISQWASITSFPQQVALLKSGNIAVANFSGTGETGIRLYTSTGGFLRLLNGVTGNRGVVQLANGNFLTTNGAGIHEVDSVTGSLVRTILATTNLQFITQYSPGTPVVAQLLTPNGGEVFTAGDTAQVTWNASGVVTALRLDYSTDNGGSWSLMADSVPAAGGAYGWIVPDEPTLAGLVRLTWVADSGVTDLSDAPFTIITSGTVVRNYAFDANWQLVAVPLLVEDSRTVAVFPGASSPAYAYQGGYVTRDSLEVGTGYWLKFPAVQIVPMVGYFVPVETVDVAAGWNLVGTVTDSVTASTVVSIPPGIIVSGFFGYSPLGYSPSASLVPSRGYWVKTSQAGRIVLRFSR